MLSSLDLMARLAGLPDSELIDLAGRPALIELVAQLYSTSEVVRHAVDETPAPLWRATHSGSDAARVFAQKSNAFVIGGKRGHPFGHCRLWCGRPRR